MSKILDLSPNLISLIVDSSPYRALILSLTCKKLRVNKISDSESILRKIILEGHLNLLLWIKEYGCPWDQMACFWAAEGGHLELLQNLKSGCPWDSRTCFAASKSGHLEILQWARDNGCDWDWQVCAVAGLEGHLPHYSMVKFE